MRFGKLYLKQSALKIWARTSIVLHIHDDNFTKQGRKIFGSQDLSRRVVMVNVKKFFITVITANKVKLIIIYKTIRQELRKSFLG